MTMPVRGNLRSPGTTPAAREDLVSQLVTDALALLAAVDVDQLSAAGGKPAESVALLALVAG